MRSSTGKYAEVAPYSGHMLDSVARSAIVSDEPRAVELDEAPHDAVRPEHLGERQHQIGRGGTRRQLPRHADPDDVGVRQERRLSEHRRLGLDPADAPAEDPETVDHRRVRVRADQRVGERHAVANARPAQMLRGSPGSESPRRAARPGGRSKACCAHRRSVPLAVAPVLPLDVGLVRLRRAEQIHLDRVVDDQVDGDDGIHAAGSPPARATALRIAVVDHGGYAV